MTFTPDVSIRSDADDLRELADLLPPSQTAIAIALRAIAVSVERRITHPCVAAITHHARGRLFNG